MTDSKTATECLRERGVGWWSKDVGGIEWFRDTRWNALGITWCFTEQVGAWTSLQARCELNITPEQAIAATLGAQSKPQSKTGDALSDDSGSLSDATLGSGECEYKPMWDEDDPLAEEYLGMWYTGCGDALIWNADNDGCGEPPKFCPSCGGKAVKR